MKITVYIALFFAGCAFWTACSEKLPDNPSGSLGFSVDTLRFDTVFTASRSSVRRLMVYNDSRRAVRTRIFMSCSDSSFRVRVDGVPLNGTYNAEIAGQDSIYLFVEADIDPQHSDIPVPVRCLLYFDVNGSKQQVCLEAYGQDVSVLDNVTAQRLTWQGDKPCLIRGQLTVDSLYIEQGVHVYLDRGANIYITGKLSAKGTVDKPIVFSGSRMEKAYRNTPGQWGSIILSDRSSENTLQHTKIRNGTNGLMAGDAAGKNVTTLEMNAVAISHMSYSGLMAFAARVTGSNCLITECGYYTVGLFCGGTGSFIHCTFANYGTVRRKSIPIFTVDRTYEQYEAQIPAVVELRNSVVYGSMNEELSLGNAVYYSFRYCLLRTLMDTSPPSFVNVLTADPKFVDPYDGNFHLEKNSPALDAGEDDAAAMAPEDMEGNNRISGKPDLGAFERP
ncbi:MAG: right-handed parallel beta-helix repeat-containing protein [Bacteroidales bacterium]|jgi:hypothetical protein|nr:right-handed parallel beta-helix repeat-containing protein [Bacteroidales bacterium]